jgi:hypothetical protein
LDFQASDGGLSLNALFLETLEVGIQFNVVRFDEFLDVNIMNALRRPFAVSLGALRASVRRWTTSEGPQFFPRKMISRTECAILRFFGYWKKQQEK